MTRTMSTFGMLLFAAAAAAQVAMTPQATPARDRPPAPALVGTAAIKGRVVDGQSGNAVSRARVRLMRMGQGAQPSVVVTDESGTFTFSALPAGSYMLTVDKPTYLAARYPEGGQTLRTSARPLTLGDGQVLQGLTMPLYRGSAIGGRVVDSHGDPVEYANVQVLRLPPSGRGRPQQRGGGSTNDLGEFRVAHLDPGRYFVFVVPRRDMFNTNGPVQVVQGVHDVQTDVADTQPVPTYYPGVPSLDQAQAITITRGTSVTGLELTVIEAYAASVSGSVVDPSGQPVTCCGSINLRPIIKDVPNGIGTTGTGLRPDGTFQFKVPPGEYEVDAQLTPRGTAGPPPPGSQQFGRVRLSVSSDMSGVVITVGAGAKISGRLVFDGTSPLPTLGPNLPNSLSVSMSPSFPDGGICRSGRADLTPDGAFTLDGVFGTCVARVNGSLGKWSVKSIQYEGKELVDQPLSFEPGQQLRDVQVILSDKHTELTLQVADESGQPTPDFVALVFSTDKTRWTEGSRYVRTYVPPTAQSTTSGMTFVTAIGAPPQIGGGGFGATANATRNLVSGLPAGEYLAVAVDDVPSDLVRDPGMLEHLARAAARVSLTDGASSEINLRRLKLADLLADR